MGRMIKEMVVQDCPIRNVLARVCDKWSLLVIYTLKYHQDGPLRFNALRKQIPDISQKMLTSTLNRWRLMATLPARLMPKCRQEWSILSHPVLKPLFLLWII